MKGEEWQGEGLVCLYYLCQDSKHIPTLTQSLFPPSIFVEAQLFVFNSYFLIRKKDSPASHIQMRHIFAICPLYESWKPSCFQLTPQICSGAFLVLHETNYVALTATGFSVAGLAQGQE